MSTPAEIMVNIRALMNDQADAVFHDEIILPYFNMTLQELQEEFELNNIPVTNVTSALINVPTGTDTIGFPPASPLPNTPYLPADLIEIQELWESQEGLSQWVPMRRLDFLPHDAEVASPISTFMIWAWMGQEIKLIAANRDNDLKLDYIKSVFTPITEDTLEDDLDVLNVDTFLQYRTSALCAMFIGENPERASVMNEQAEIAKSRLIGISNKGEQMVFTRRLPFRMGYKTLGRML